MLKKMKVALFSAMMVVMGVIAYGQQMSTEQREVVVDESGYKVIVSTSANAQITRIIVREGDAEEEVPIVDQTNWSRVFTNNLPVHVSVSGRAIQANDSSAKMTVKVFKDGEPFRTANAQGVNLEANVGF